MAVAATQPHRVIIIGSGFGGLFAARALRGAPVDVTVIDRMNHHLFQPLLYQVATGILSEGQIAPAIRDILRWHRNTRVQLGTVTAIDIEARTVTATQGERVLVDRYDSLIVAAGAQPTYFGHPEFSQWASGMKTIDDALELRGQIFGAFEVAETEPDRDARADWLTFAIVGGGPTGVELAGQIAELSRRSLGRNFRSIDPADARVLLFEGSTSVLGSYGPRLSADAAATLEGLGVEIHTDTMVVGMDEAGLTVKAGDGTTTTYPARTKIWAAGVQGVPLGRMVAEATGAEVDKAGRVKVRPDCTVPGHPEIFVIGDLMALDDLPGLAEVAMQSGIFAARTIRQRVAGRPTKPKFRYIDLGTVAVVSRFRAVAKLGRFGVGGHLGWLLWLVVHLTFLTGFKNRISALARWAISFIGTDRTERTITTQQVIARHILETHRASTALPPEAPGPK